MTHERHQGGQPGNQNARTHGFYSRSLPPKNREELDDAAKVDGLDQEIALLRSKIAAAAENPEHYHLLIPGMSLLSRLLRTKQKLGYDKQNQLTEGIKNALRSVGYPAEFARRRLAEMSQSEEPETNNSQPDSPLSSKNDPRSV